MRSVPLVPSLAAALAVAATAGPAPAQFRAYPPVVRAFPPVYRPIPPVIRAFPPVYRPPLYPVVPLNPVVPFTPGVVNPYFNPYVNPLLVNPYGFGLTPVPYAVPVPVPVPAPVAQPAPVPAVAAVPPPPAPADPTPVPRSTGPAFASANPGPAKPFAWFPREPAAPEIRVVVPVPGAKVTVNGAALSGTGTERTFAVDQIKGGERHEYTVVATWTADGKPVTREKKVTLDGTGPVVADFRPDAK